MAGRQQTDVFALIPLRLHDYPVLLTLGTFTLSFIVSVFMDRFAVPKRVRRAKRQGMTWKNYVFDVAVRLPIIALVFAGFFAISWRPLYAGAGTMSFFIIFMAISRAKFQFIREPLVFSDIALVADVFKYKTIFYASKLNIVFWIVSFSYVFGVSGLYMWFEPHVLPEHNHLFWIFVMWVIANVTWFLLFFAPINAPIAATVQRFMPVIEPRLITVRFGAFCSVIFNFLIWLGVRREKIVAEMSNRILAAFQDLIDQYTTDKAPVVVVWQSESFIDMRHFDVPGLALPTIDRMKQRAVQWGRLNSVFEGGYTLRTEFAVLSGLQPDDIHVDASYPYLRASHYADVVWPGKMRAAGWKTHFVHPYDRTFFLRHKAMPQLGFDHMSMLDSFDHDPGRDGPYVNDDKLTEKVLGICEEVPEDQPGLVFVASMANHGPWEPDRVPGMTDPVEIYLELLQQSDRALAKLLDGLNHLDRPVWLLFYGDHAPLLKSFADPFPDPRTDYFIVPLSAARKAQHAPTFPKNEDPANLVRVLLNHAGLNKERLS